MRESLLNDNQRRHMATFLHLLHRDVTQLKRGVSLGAPVHDAIDAVLGSAQEIADAFELVVPREPDLRHQIRVVAEVWGMRIHDIRAAPLKSYGPVHPALAERLDPLVMRLHTHLRELSGAAAREL